MVEVYQAMESFYALIGPDGDTPAWWQMIIRSLIVFLTGLTLLRLGARRMFGRSTPFDMVLAIIIGSILSRAITGNSPFLATLAAAAALVLLHWSVALLSYYSDGLSFITKGAKRELVTKGEINWKAMRRGKVGKSDLFKALRMRASPILPAFGMPIWNAAGKSASSCAGPQTRIPRFSPATGTDRISRKGSALGSRPGRLTPPFTRCPAPGQGKELTYSV